ncbi:MAG: YbhB/YbcL family Raf kinase inhibitor-like protein [Pseudomonadota bacterium]
MKLTIQSWPDGGAIPSKFALARIPDDGPFELSDNINPELAWQGAPGGTKSFAVLIHDPDVPSSPEDVNREDRVVPSDLARITFYHWVLVDIPADRTAISEGADSAGVTPGGKTPGPGPHGTTGINSYTDWFKGDADMGGEYGGYDGPCPPWNDSIVHHYHVTLYALDVVTLGLSGAFTGPDVLAAMDGHILAQASHTGLYSMNPDVPAI